MNWTDRYGVEPAEDYVVLCVVLCEVVGDGGKCGMKGVL